MSHAYPIPVARAAARLAMSLIEIMAVVVILGLLAVTLTVSFAGKMGRAKHEIATAQIGQIVAQVQMFQLETRKLPATGDGLMALTVPAATPTASYFIEPAKLVDPWGNRYQLKVPGPGGYPFEVISHGADGQPGGSGEDADLSSITAAPVAR